MSYRHLVLENAVDFVPTRRIGLVGVKFDNFRQGRQIFGIDFFFRNLDLRNEKRRIAALGGKGDDISDPHIKLRPAMVDLAAESVFLFELSCDINGSYLLSVFCFFVSRGVRM